MAFPATGAAFVDRSGTVLAADGGFVASFGVPASEAAAALRARIEASPELRALLAADGPGVARIAGVDGPLDVERIPAAGGALLVLRDPAAADRGEHALRSQLFGRIVSGVAHDIKNPLNAMSLQLALLGDKLEGAAGVSQAASGHLAALREQIARVNEVLRRLVDVTDPSAQLGYTDLGALVADVGCLFGYDARRRRIEVAAADAHAGPVRTRCEPGRVARLVLAIYGRALACTPDGGRLAARAEGWGSEAAVAVEHTMGDPEGGLRYETELLAAGAEALGGRLERTNGERRMERLVLVVPGNE